MGLDMFLTAKRFMWHDEDGLKGKISSAFPDLPEGVTPQEVEFEVGYWRKANAIHKWFVDNVQDGKDDCGTYWVSDEMLEVLLGLCRAVKDNHSLAEKLLPTKSGFFFGDIGYTQWYFEDIELTIKNLERALALREQNPGKFQLEYTSSW